MAGRRCQPSLHKNDTQCGHNVDTMWTEKSIKIENTVGTDENGHSMSSPRKQCLEQFPMPKIQNSAAGEISKGGQQDGFL